jgi:hypothetical protein
MGVFAKLDGIKTMPHLVTWDAITGNQAPQGDLSHGVPGSFSLVQKDGQTFYKGPDGQLLGPLGGEGVFSSQSLDDKGSVIVGDNHFRTGGDDDALTGIDSDGSNYMTGQGGITNQLEHGPGLHDSVHCIVGGTMCSVIRGDGDNKGSFNSQGFRNLVGHDSAGGMTYLTETLEPIAGMYSFGESLNPALEFGGASGPNGMSVLTGNIGFSTNTVGGRASSSGDDI